jgi:hypothetical protein
VQRRLAAAVAFGAAGARLAQRASVLSCDRRICSRSESLDLGSGTAVVRSVKFKLTGSKEGGEGGRLKGVLGAEAPGVVGEGGRGGDCGSSALISDRPRIDKAPAAGPRKQSLDPWIALIDS